jgi:type IX secretion system PorP/SprF family membrane protein
MNNLQNINLMKKLALFLAMVLSLAVSGQRDALYYQYLFNYHVINPAFSGSMEKLVFTITNRNQWVGIRGAPHTMTFSGHTLLKTNKIGVGGYIYADRFGPLTDFGMISTYAYRIDMEEYGLLSLGLQFGFKQLEIDWDALYMENMNDFYLIVRPKGGIYPDANFGVYYNIKQFFIGISTKHLFERYFMEWGSQKGHNFSNLHRHVYTYIGGFLKINNRLMLKPSVLIKYVDVGSFCFDLNASMLIDKLFWLGVSYRSQKNSFVFLCNFKANSKFQIGYSYDTYLGDVKAYNIGTHEIKLSYEIDTYQRKGIRQVYF